MTTASDASESTRCLIAISSQVRLHLDYLLQHGVANAPRHRAHYVAIVTSSTTPEVAYIT